MKVPALISVVGLAALLCGGAYLALRPAAEPEGASEKLLGRKRPPPSAEGRVEVESIPAEPSALAAVDAPVAVAAAPVPEPDPVETVSNRSRGGGGYEDEPMPVMEKIVRTHANSTLEEMQIELRDVEFDLGRRKEVLGKAEWSLGEWQTQVPGEGLPRSNRLRYDGIPEEVWYRRARDERGNPVMRYVTLPFEKYPEYYDLKAEAIRLRAELRQFEDEE